MEIKPGSTVTVEIKGTPHSAAAVKTLHRLCRKDAEVARRERWLQRHRPSWQTHRRGGRPWHHQMKSATGVTLTVGQRYRFRATVDVLRDLESVAAWVQVSAG